MVALLLFLIAFLGFLVCFLEGGVLTAVLSEEEFVLGENPREGGRHTQGLITAFTNRDHQENSSIYSVTEM